VSLSDTKFGTLTIISSPRPDVFKCRCKCGNEVEVWHSQLANGVIRHCGCRDHRRPALQRKKLFLTLHFRSVRRKSGWRKKFATGELNSYLSMITRCYRKTTDGEYRYENWGGKGIRVCDRWLEPNGKAKLSRRFGPEAESHNTGPDKSSRPLHPAQLPMGHAKEQAVHKTHIMWKDESPPPIPSIRDTNEEIDTMFGPEPY
jgi:hypothetical protein